MVPLRVVSSYEELQEQLLHPTPEIVWARAREVLGSEKNASEWMSERRSIFGGQSPEELVNTQQSDKLRDILTVLARIEFGIVS